MSGPLSFNLLQKQTQNQKQSQLLMMMPHMQQAISLLQAPTIELLQLVEHEMENNPLLEYLDEISVEEEQEPPEKPLEEQELVFNENDFSILRQLDDEYRDLFNEGGEAFVGKEVADKQNSYVEHSLVAPESLFEHLMVQAHDFFTTENDIHVTKYIVGNLDEKGLLTLPLEEIATEASVTLEVVERVLAGVQTFEPLGVAAQSTQESLLNQLVLLGKKESLAYTIVHDHYDDLLHNRLPQIHIKLKVTVEEIRAAVDEDIAKLDLQPGSVYSNRDPIQIVPEGSILEVDGEVVITLNDDSLPSIRVNRKYLRMLNKPGLDKETKEFIHNGLTSAKWLLKNLFQRNKTIHRILDSIARHQRSWFLNSSGELIPMGMAEVAEELDLHESTIARAVQNKYIFTPRGMRLIRHFFTQSLEHDSEGEMSVHTVRKKIQVILSAEDKTKPISDEKISQLLLEEGIHCARRTVAKYRTKLGLGNTSQRRIHKSS